MAEIPHKKPLTLQQQLFVTEYLKHGDAKASALAAKYSEKNAQQQGYELLRNCPAVKEAIKKARTELQAKGVYNLERAMEECDEGIAFAKQTRNANAYAKFSELKAKLNGLLVEKHEVKQVGFLIQIGGITDVTPQLPVIDVKQIEGKPDDNATE